MFGECFWSDKQPGGPLINFKNPTRELEALTMIALTETNHDIHAV
jgi:hypothetical protein